MLPLLLFAATLICAQPRMQAPTRTAAATTALMLGLDPRELATAGAADTETGAMLNRLAEAKELRVQFHTAHVRCVSIARNLREVCTKYRSSPRSTQAATDLVAASSAYTSARNERVALQTSLARVAMAAIPAVRQVPIRPMFHASRHQSVPPDAQVLRQLMQVFTTVL